MLAFPLHTVTKTIDPSASEDVFSPSSLMLALLAISAWQGAQLARLLQRWQEAHPFGGRIPTRQPRPTEVPDISWNVSHRTVFSAAFVPRGGRRLSARAWILAKKR